MQRSFRRAIPVGMKYGLRPAASGFSTELYTDRQDKKGRILSPHVDIYAFPPTAITSGIKATIASTDPFSFSSSARLSVAIRITGAALSGGLTCAAALALAGADVPSMASNIGSITLVGELAKFTVAFPIVYHYLGALRHMYWDKNPEELTTDKVTQMSYMHGGSAVAISAGLALVTLAPL